MEDLVTVCNSGPVWVVPDSTSGSDAPDGGLSDRGSSLSGPACWRLPVPTRGPFVRVLLGAGACCVAVLALVGGVALRGSGMVAVVLAGAVSACLAAGVARETSGVSRTPPLEAAVQAAGGAIGALLVLAGTAAAGGGLAAVLVGTSSAIAGLAVWLVRSPRPSRDLSPHTLTSDAGRLRPAGPG